jgi:F0F1-type ATP synthase delta subunit
VIRNIASETIVVPTGEVAIHFNGIITLNKTGKVLFSALQTEKTIDELVDLLYSQFDVSRENALKDIVDFVQVLNQNHLLVEHD